MNLIVLLLILAILFSGLGGYGYWGGTNWPGHYSGGFGGAGLLLLIVVIILVLR